MSRGGLKLNTKSLLGSDSAAEGSCSGIKLSDVGSSIMGVLCSCLCICRHLMMMMSICIAYSCQLYPQRTCKKMSGREMCWSVWETYGKALKEKCCFSLTIYFFSGMQVTEKLLLLFKRTNMGLFFSADQNDACVCVLVKMWKLWQNLHFISSPPPPRKKKKKESEI